MKNLLNRGLQLTTLSFLLTSLVACSGSSGSGTSSAAPGSQNQPGQFVDALVGGLRYQSSSQSGIKLTTEQGEFSCAIGETISFYLDQDDSTDILLGRVPCRSVISPIELITNGSKNIDTALIDLTGTERQKVANMLRLIQSLDIDLAIGNGVYLEPSVMEDVVDYLVFQSGSAEQAAGSIQAMLALSEEDFDSELDQLMAAIGRTGKAVSESNAIAHFEAYRANCSESGCSGPPVVIPENRYTCIAGYSLMFEAEEFVSIVDTMTGQIRAQYVSENEEVSATMVVIYEDQTAKVYRRANAGFLGLNQTLFSNSAQYTRYNAQWTFDDNSEVLSVNNIAFKDSLEVFRFENVANLGVTSILMDADSSAVNTQADPTVRDAVTEWAIKHNCALPPEGDPQNRGDGSN